ncbi:unnamed protein product [Boreogadus saida]
MNKLHGDMSNTVKSPLVGTGCPDSKSYSKPHTTCKLKLQCLEVWVAAQVVVECSPTVTLSVRVTSQGLRSAIPMGEGTRRYRQSECRLLFS